MNHITITDEAILNQIEQGLGSLPVRDGNGKLRGYLVPVPLSKLQPQISEEEMKRRMADRSQGYSTEEVLNYLKSLPKKKR